MKTHSHLNPVLTLGLAASFGIGAGSVQGAFTVTQASTAPTSNVVISQSITDSQTPWRHNQQVGVDRNPRDTGQTFFVDGASFPQGLLLDTITFEVNSLSSSGYDGAGFQIAIFNFTDATDVVPDGPAIFSEGGNLPASFKADFDLGSLYITADITDLALTGGQQYGFELNLDGPTALTSDNMLVGGKTNPSSYAGGFAFRRESRGTGGDNYAASGWQFLNPSSFNSDGDMEFYLQGTAIPEPSALALAVLGALGLVARRRR